MFTNKIIHNGILLLVMFLYLCYLLTEQIVIKSHKKAAKQNSRHFDFFTT